MDTLKNNHARAADINHIRRQIIVFNNRKALGLDQIDDQEFLALVDNSSILISII